MFNVCIKCGLYRVDKEIDPAGPDAICPECGYRRRFAYLPLLIVCGPSGAGKSTIINRLAGKIDEAILLEGDILWRPEFADPEISNDGFMESWLRIAKNINESGRPVVLFSSGAIPENVERCVESRYFSAIHYLALVYDDDMLRERLQARPEWRGSGGDTFISDQIRFNNWFKDQASDQADKIDLLDTTTASIGETADAVANWIRMHA